MKIAIPSRVLSMLIALLAAGALLVAGCGGGDGGGGGGSGDAQALLEQAFSKNAGNKVQDADVKVALSADFDGGPPQVQQPLKLEFGGPMKSKGEKEFPELDWDFKAQGLGKTIDGGVLVTADNAFVSYKGQDYEVGKATFQRFKTQSESQSGGRSNSLSGLNLDPNDFLTDLKEEDGEPVDGIATQRVTGTVDTEKLIRSFLKVLKDPSVRNRLQGRSVPELSDDQIKKVSDAVKGVDFSVDIDKPEKVVRRLNATVDFEVPDDSQSDAQGLKGGKLAFKIEVGKLDPGTKITGPSGARPLKELTQQLGLGLLGGGLGGAGGTTTLPQQ